MDASARSPRKHSIKQCTANTLALNRRIDVEQIYTSCLINSGETRNMIVRLGNKDTACSQTASPPFRIRSVRRPRGNLNGRVVSPSDLTHRPLKQFDYGLEIIRPVFADHDHSFDAERRGEGRGDFTRPCI
jgi:hypothetical protein